MIKLMQSVPLYDYCVCDDEDGQSVAKWLFGVDFHQIYFSLAKGRIPLKP